MAVALPIDLSRTYTAEEFAVLPDDDRRCELVDGRVVPMIWPTSRHSWVSEVIRDVLATYIKPRGLGYVLREIGVILRRAPDTVRGPDVAFFSKGRTPIPFPEPYMPAPDLAVEVLSPSNRRSQVARKVSEYLRAGVRAVWVADSRARTITIHSPGADPVVLSEADTLDGGEIIPGFRHRVSALFADPT
jgi:Uma2 family endonuclease